MRANRVDLLLIGRILLASLNSGYIYVLHFDVPPLSPRSVSHILYTNSNATDFHSALPLCGEIRAGVTHTLII
jgi:hypothetical protein